MEERLDFYAALGEEFSEYVSPPVPFEDASPHECCEVVWQVVGRNVTPTKLASMSDAQVADLASAFGRYFETDAPSVERIKQAIVATLARWPVGSTGDNP